MGTGDMSLQSMRSNNTKVFFGQIYFLKIWLSASPLGGGGLEYMQIFSPIAPLEQKIWAFEMSGQVMSCVYLLGVQAVKNYFNRLTGTKLTG